MRSLRQVMSRCWPLRLSVPSLLAVTAIGVATVSAAAPKAAETQLNPAPDLVGIALATGWFNSGANVGAILAPLLVPWITLHYGWQMAFMVLGATGFVWLFFWYWLYAIPAESRRVSASELAHIQSDPPEPPSEIIPWMTLLRYRQTWAFVVGISLSGFLLKHGWSVNASRKTALLICALCVVPMVFAARASNLWVATMKPAEVNHA